MFRLILALGLNGFLATPSAFVATAAHAKAASPIAAYDIDKDGTLDLDSIWRWPSDCSKRPI
jgi:hypothetical protein